MGVVRKGGANGLNQCADDLAGKAISEAPIETGELRASAVYPAIDPSHAASQVELEAIVSFNKVYAAAQHEGQIVYEAPVTYVVNEYTRTTKTGAVVVREHTATIGPGVVELRNHPRGGKSHYLSDPFKAGINRYEEIVAAAVKKEVEEWAAKRR